MQVGIYTRLSKDRDGTQTATERQAAECRRLAEHHGWHVAEVYEDTDLSGFKRGVHRPDYERMLTDLESGSIRSVLVWKIDRLTRQPGQFERVVDVCQRVGARIHSVHDPADMTTPTGLGMLRVGMTFAAMESEGMALRVRAAKAEDANKGRPNGGGNRPFGVGADGRTLVPHEAELIREAAHRVIAGESVMSICRDWADRGIQTSKGNAFVHNTLKSLLINPRLAGKRMHKGTAIDSDVIPAILPGETVERLRTILMDPNRNTVREVRSRLLTGFLVCGRCGHKLTPKNRKEGTSVYRCAKTPGKPPCGGLVVTGAPVEAIVTEALLGALESPAMGTALTVTNAEHDVAVLTTAIAADESRLAQLAQDHYADGIIGRTEFLAARGPIQARIDHATKQLADIRQRDILGALHLSPGETVRTAWERADVHWRRALLGTHIESISVAPADPNRRQRNVFDPNRLTIRWRSR